MAHSDGKRQAVEDSLAIERLLVASGDEQIVRHGEAMRPAFGPIVEPRVRMSTLT
jgi:hypothetical protein